MGRKIGKPSNISDVNEFKTKGFVKHTSGNSCLLFILRRSYGEYLRIFNSGYNISVGRTGAKYGTYDLFGERTCYYYDIRKEKEFVVHLVEKFYEKNPSPDKAIRKVFTRLLHTYKLHWFGCTHDGKRRYDLPNAESFELKTKEKIRKSRKRCKDMHRKEAFIIVEEILRMVVSPDTHFQENMKEYICDKLDISDESLTDVLDIISKENDE